MLCINQGLHRALREYPAAVACVSPGGKETTYAELGDRCARLAGALRMLGMKRDDAVAMLAINGHYYYEYMLGVPWGDGVLNPCNTRWSLRELVYSIEDAGSTILIVDESFKTLGRQIAERVKSLRHVIYAGSGDVPEGMLSYERLLAEAQPIPDMFRKDDDLFGVFYTGGTTGLPKGVMLTHGGVWLGAIQYNCAGLYPKNGVMLQIPGLFHIAGISNVAGNLLHGNTVVFAPVFPFEPRAILDLIERYGVTDMMMVPTMLQMTVDCPEFAASDISSLRRIVYGAAPMSEGLLSRMLSAFPGIELRHSYGQTELSGPCTFLGPEHHKIGGQSTGKLRSVGRPAVAMELKIVDENGNEVPRGTVGEIVARSHCIMAGYWRKPEQTVDAFTADGWLRTGDGGSMDEDGYIYIADRIKDMIISGGENVFSVEVESVVSTHPAVAACAVIGIPSQKWGESVHVVVVLKQGGALTEQQLREYCKERLAGYKCPRSLEIRDALPLSAAGKVLKWVLREPYWSSKPITASETA